MACLAGTIRENTATFDLLTLERTEGFTIDEMRVIILIIPALLFNFQFRHPRPGDTNK